MTEQIDRDTVIIQVADRPTEELIAQEIKTEEINVDYKVDILAIGAHPDDIEMFMGGTIIKLKDEGYLTAVCDLTRGELGTYGSAQLRLAEQKESTAVLGLDHRITLDIPDGFVSNTPENQIKIINVIRRYKPEIVFTFANLPMRHPDHYHCGQLVRESCYKAGLKKIETEFEAYRPAQVIGFPELIFDKPSFVIDISHYWEQREQAIRCFGSQVIGPGEDDSTTKTLIRSNSFWEIQEGRGTMAGAAIGVRYGEPFYTDHAPQILDPVAAFTRRLR